MANITINSEDRERELVLNYTSDRPSVRRPYTRKAHIPEDDTVFGNSDTEVAVNMYIGEDGVHFSGSGIFNLHHLRIEAGETPADLGFTIGSMPNLRIYVPAELVDTIKADENWAEFADCIFAEPEDVSDSDVIDPTPEP